MNNFKLYICFFLVFILSCKNENNIETCINWTLYEYGYKQKAVFYKTKNNSFVKSTNKYTILPGSTILKNLDENFLDLYIDKENPKYTLIGFFSYKTGKGMSCFYDKKGNLIFKQTFQTKLMESKPYYIYYEIMKRKYPNYMDWKHFYIPKDSLK